MDRRKFSFSIIAAAALAGCGGGDGFQIPTVTTGGDSGTPTPTGPELASATSLPAATLFPQSVTNNDPDAASVAPGQANYFDLDRDFTIMDGGNDQLDGALYLSITVNGTSYDFPSDQTYAELTALGPELTAADGLKTVSFTTDAPWVADGARSAVLHAVPDARLQQRLDLTGATGALSLTWGGYPNVGYNYPDEPYFCQVVVRDTAGALLDTLYRQDRSGSSGTWGSASLTAHAGQVVVLSFESCATYGAVVIDDVALVDGASVSYVTNGDFEAGGTGWTVPDLRVSQNVRTGARSITGVGSVQRTFFTQPNALWGRMTDTFTNTSGADLAATIQYYTNLGSDGWGIVYATPGATAKALTTWDGRTGDRDVGLVFGTADTVTYTSASAIATHDGSDDIYVQYNVTVPAGGTVTLVNFVILSGTDTGATATSASARATDVDTIAADIANNFRTNFAYQRGLTQDQLDTLKNF
jgi:hypothetical protein